MKKIKEMALLLEFIYNQYYSFVLSTLQFLKVSFHKTKMTLNIVKAKIALDTVNGQRRFYWRLLPTVKREYNTALTPF